MPGRGRVNTRVPREHVAFRGYLEDDTRQCRLRRAVLEIRRATPETVHGLETAVGPSGPSLNFTDFQATAAGRMKHCVSPQPSMGRAHWRGRGAKALRKRSMTQVPCLKTLNLGGNNLGPEATRGVAGALMKGQDEPLSMPQLASGCALEELDLAGNHIGSSGVLPRGRTRGGRMSKAERAGS